MVTPRVLAILDSVLAGVAALALVACDDASAPSADVTPTADVATDTDASADAAAPADADGAPCPLEAPAWGAGEGLMLPGSACLDCHAAGASATDHPFVIAGTAFVARDCPLPAATPEQAAVVHVVDGAGARWALPVNAAGNFWSAEVGAGPWTVSLERGGVTVAMTVPATDGDCNGCHAPDVAGWIFPAF